MNIIPDDPEEFKKEWEEIQKLTEGMESPIASDYIESILNNSISIIDFNNQNEITCTTNGPDIYLGISNGESGGKFECYGVNLTLEKAKQLAYHLLKIVNNEKDQTT